MELKFTLDGTHQQVAIRSNCTFMELKWKCFSPNKPRYTVLIVPLWNWNNDDVIRNIQYGVLIVPLWNWNDGGELGVSEQSRCSNCTFMELKFIILDFFCLKLGSSNCTFMELKLTNHWQLVRHHKVLIVPLWNWNDD